MGALDGVAGAVVGDDGVVEWVAGALGVGAEPDVVEQAPTARIPAARAAARAVLIAQHRLPARLWPGK